MKTKKIFGILLLFLCAFSLISCHGDDDDYVGEIVNMSVEPKVVWVDDESSIDPKIPAMECTIEGSNEKRYLGLNQIEGFEYKGYFKYKLKVRITPLENPTANGYTEKYELIEIISQNKTVPLYKIQLKYAVDAELEDVIENDLQMNSSIYAGSSYAMDSNWILVDANNAPILNMEVQLESNYCPSETELPASYKLIQPSEQIATYVKMTFMSNSGYEQVKQPYYTIITLRPGGGRDPVYCLWLYEDLTDYYKTKYPDAGVRGVVRVQHLSWDGLRYEIK